MTLNKLQLINEIASESDLSKADEARALNAATDAVASTISDGVSVQLTGFGPFVVRDHTAQTSASIQI
ncbi:MAG: HU family DNA-binding protein [Candidatus Thioglobus sp.]|nr:HU family DNA-binding protein [Candidatus Thioglobus sp.]